MLMPLKKILVGYVAQRILKRALPRVIPGGLALIVVAEATRYAVKHFVTDKSAQKKAKAKTASRTKMNETQAKKSSKSRTTKKS